MTYEIRDKTVNVPINQGTGADSTNSRGEDGARRILTADGKIVPLTRK